MQQASRSVGFAGQRERAGSSPGPNLPRERAEGAGAHRAVRLPAGTAGRRRGEGWSWMPELGREGGRRDGCTGCTRRVLQPPSPGERRDGAELPREEGILPKVGPRGQASSHGVPGRGRPVGSAVGSIALPGSGTNFGPCHAQGDRDTPRPHAGGQARDKVAREATPRAAPWLQAPCRGECLPPFPSRPPAVPLGAGTGTEQPGHPGGAHPAPPPPAHKPFVEGARCRDRAEPRLVALGTGWVG